MQTKHLSKVQNQIIIKTLSKLIIERNFLNLIKSIYKYLVANITLNSERFNPFPLVKKCEGSEITLCLQSSKPITVSWVLCYLFMLP